MQKIQYDEYGGPDLLHLDEVEPASPGKGQVLVRVRAAAANPMDWRIRNGEVKLMTGRRFRMWGCGRELQWRVFLQ